MQQDTGQETLPRVSMEVGIKYEGIPQLVPAMHRMPQMHQLQEEQALGGVSPSFV